MLKNSCLPGRIVSIFILFFLMTGITTAGSGEKPAKKPELVLIPGGEFVMGKEIPADKIAKMKKKPYIDFAAHKVYVDSFYMDKYEVTNAQYHRFCKETGHQLPGFWGRDEFHCGLKYPEHPVDETQANFKPKAIGTVKVGIGF